MASIGPVKPGDTNPDAERMALNVAVAKEEFARQNPAVCVRCDEHVRQTEDPNGTLIWVDWFDIGHCRKLKGQPGALVSVVRHEVTGQ